MPSSEVDHLTKIGVSVRKKVMRCGCTPAGAKISKIFRDLLFCLQKKGLRHWIASKIFRDLLFCLQKKGLRHWIAYLKRIYWALQAIAVARLVHLHAGFFLLHR